jgi:hypothetical protein
MIRRIDRGAPWRFVGSDGFLPTLRLRHISRTTGANFRRPVHEECPVSPCLEIFIDSLVDEADEAIGQTYDAVSPSERGSAVTSKDKITNAEH